ncbi:MAG: efflux RND transporter permease subunit [Ignavibacteriales bacterium]|nr:efflux RND transporter permease subunit [Ignavibacteriales bacterium]
MSLSSISIQRPVLAIVMSVVLVIFGFIGASFLGVREYPNIDPPIITVSCSFTGANAEIIESQITEPLEESINGVAGIKSITSTSRDGRSNIKIEFGLNIDIEDAANDVRDRVSQAINSLPPDVDPPVVYKADADANPILSVSISSPTRNLLELSDMGNRIFKERLQTIPGVSAIELWGEKRYSMRIWIDPVRLASYKLTPLEVSSALSSENIELPSGRIEGQKSELTIRTRGLLTTEEEFNNLIVKETGGSFIRLKDIGYAKLGPLDERTVLKRNGIPAIGVVLVPQPGSNHINIANDFYKRLEQIKKDLPKDILVEPNFDTTKYIKESISEVIQSIFIAFVLVIIIIFLFLRDWRSTFIPIIVIPISLIATFFVLYLVEYSINVLTLLGVVLAIGIVVDDAIIVLENIYKKIELGMEPLKAGMEGVKEIFFAVLATTVALVSVFLPLMFLQGFTGRLFREFGVTIAASVIISSFVALTLTPMVSTRFLGGKKGHSKFYYFSEPFFEKLNSIYKSTLDSFMAKRWMAFIVVVVAFAALFYFGSILQSELAPMEDRSGMRIQSTGAEGSSFENMDNYMNLLYDMVEESVPEALAVVSRTGTGGSGNSGFIRIQLVSPPERERSQHDIYLDLSKKINILPNARSVIIEDQAVSTRGRGLPVQFVIQAPDLERLRKVLPAFMEKVGANPNFQFFDVNLKFTKPEIVVEVNREKAKDLGISILDISRTLQLTYSGRRMGYFIMNGKQYEVIGQVQRVDRAAPLDLKSLYVKNSRGDMIQLDNIVSLKERSNPPQLYRFNRYVAATVSAGLIPGKTIGEGIEEMEKIADQVLDESFATSLDGASKDFQESTSNLYFIFMLALVLIYLVLAAQFESFRSPFIIMFTVPLAISGALFTLWYFNQTLNIFSEIGMIMLIGLVTKNGILIVEFANQRREQGLDIIEAVKGAAVARLRPILMTSLSTILGILPIALSLGAGSESRSSMGIAVIGGLMLSTFLTLFVIPALYTFIAKKDSKQFEIYKLWNKR